MATTTAGTTVHVYADDAARRRGAAQRALVAESIAEALTGFAGVTDIVVHAGTYAEIPMVISGRQHLNLSAAPKENVVLINVPVGADATAFLDVECSNVKITGFTFQLPAKASGLRVMGRVENVHISKCVFIGGGVRFEAGCNFAFRDNELQNSTGVACVECRGVVSDNVFNKCTENALSMEMANELSVLGNTFSQGWSHAICAVNSVNLTISANRISCARTGIFLNGCVLTKINDNHIFDCPENGICICDVDERGASVAYSRRRIAPEAKREDAPGSSSSDDAEGEADGGANGPDGGAGKCKRTRVPEDATRVLSNFVYRIGGCGIEVDAMPPPARSRDRRRQLLVAENHIFDCRGIGLLVSGAVTGGLFVRNVICGNQHVLGNIVVSGRERADMDGGYEDAFVMQDRLQGGDAPEISRNTVAGLTSAGVLEAAGLGQATSSAAKNANAGSRKALLGVSLIHGARATVRRNHVHGHTADGVRVSSNARGSVVRSNTVSRNGEAGVHFVLDVRSLLPGESDNYPGCRVEKNTIFDNGATGVTVTLVTRTDGAHHVHGYHEPDIAGRKFSLGTFTNNEIFGNKQLGLFIDVDASSFTREMFAQDVRGLLDFRENDVHENGVAGIFFKGSLVGDLEDHDNPAFATNASSVEAEEAPSSPAESAEAGGDVTAAPGVRKCTLLFRVYANKVSDEPGCGIVARSCGHDCKIAKNVVRNCAESGVLLLQECVCAVEANVLDTNKEYGVLCRGRLRALVAGNEIKGSKHAGVGVAELAAPVVRANNIHHNTKGVHVFDGGAGAIIGNRIHDNSDIGIALSTGGNAAVSENAITDCRLGAIVAFDRAAGKVFKNAFKLNVTPPKESWYHYGLGQAPNWVVVCDAMPTDSTATKAHTVNKPTIRRRTTSMSRAKAAAKPPPPPPEDRYSTTTVLYNRGSAPVILSAISVDNMYDEDGDAGGDDGDGSDTEEVIDPRAARRGMGHVIKKYLPPKR